MMIEPFTAWAFIAVVYFLTSFISQRERERFVLRHMAGLMILASIGDYIGSDTVVGISTGMIISYLFIHMRRQSREFRRDVPTPS